VEVQTIEVENLKTQEKLIQAVEYYREIQDEISRLELSKKIAREALLEKFREMSLRVFDTPSSLRARVDTRKSADHINIQEAKALLDADIFEKLRHEGSVSVVLSVRPIKAEEEHNA